MKKESIFKRITQSSLFSVILFLLVLWVFLGIATPKFVSFYNLRVIMQSAMITAVVGFSQVVVMSTGGMNLAIGYIGGMAAIFCASAMQDWGLSTPVAILFGLGVGALAGFINGFLIHLLGGSGAMGWLVTLATSFAFQGVTLGYSKAGSFVNLNADFNKIGADLFLGFPVLMYIMLAIALILWAFFKYSGLGKQILAFGANRRAAMLYGVRQRTVLYASHILSGVLAALAGMMLSSRMGIATVDIGGDWMLYSFAGPVIGGCRQAGGKVSIWGAVLGAIILSTIENGIVHLNIDVYWTEFIRGVVILLAVVIDMVRNKRKVRAK